MSKYSEQDLQNIISEVEAGFKKSLNETEEIEEVEVSLSKSDEDHDYDDEDQEEMEKMYKEMTKGEAELHYKAVKKACYGMASDMSKSENEEFELVKSENEELKAENDNLKKSVDQLVAVLKKNVNKAPERKAVTDIQYIAKGEVPTQKEEKTYSRDEAIKKLRNKASEATLSKKDRDSITDFTLNKNLSIDTIKHLL